MKQPTKPSDQCQEKVMVTINRVNSVRQCKKQAVPESGVYCKQHLKLLEQVANALEKVDE